VLWSLWRKQIAVKPPLRKRQSVKDWTRALRSVGRDTAGKGDGRVRKDQAKAGETIGIRVQIEEVEYPPETVTAIGPVARVDISQLKLCKE